MAECWAQTSPTPDTDPAGPKQKESSLSEADSMGSTRQRTARNHFARRKYRRCFRNRFGLQRKFLERWKHRARAEVGRQRSGERSTSPTGHETGATDQPAKQNYL